MDENFIYAPKNCSGSSSDEFKCHVPLDNTTQKYIVDGKGDFDGLNLPKGEVMENLLQIIQIRSKESEQELEYAANYNLGEGSMAKVLLCSHTFSMCQFKTTEQVNVKIGKGAYMDMVVMQNEHNLSNHSTSFNVDVEQDATLNLYIITLHGGAITNNVEVSLNGKGANCNVNGLYLADSSQRINTQVNIWHNVAGCMSNQLFKGILDGESRTMFSGKIYVAKDAQKTEAYQANNNLLVSKKAKAYTQPHLEIYADDVKCSHGATVGSLDENELFYMRSRGISLNEAKLLQQQAFAYAVLDKIPNAQLRERLGSMVESRLRGEFSECANCSKHCC
ncbi:MAG: Fe-S cluster assembly protein SufD [Bacteroidia bacterium]|nr:Fe-S cluster assembly protein SufD [Bacteroidia bacterium]